jgi:hypothetical protein
MTTYYNPAGSSGGTPIGDWTKWQTDAAPAKKQSYQVYGDGTPVNPPKKGFLQSLYDEQKAKYGEAKAANEGRYNQGLALLGLGSNGSPMNMTVNGQPASSTVGQYPMPNFQMPYQDPIAQGPASSSINWNGKNTELGAKADQDAVSRGIYNTSGALNQKGLSNSLALMEQDRANKAQAMQERSMLNDAAYRQAAFNYGAQQDQASRDDMLRGQRIDWIGGRQDPYPDPSVIATLAGQYGSGTQQGLDPGAFMGGGGGGFASAESLGFNIPGQSYGYGGFDWSGGGGRGYSTQRGPSAAETAQAARMRQDEMDAKRAYGARRLAPGGDMRGANLAYEQFNSGLDFGFRG